MSMEELAAGLLRELLKHQHRGSNNKRNEEEERVKDAPERIATAMTHRIREAKCDQWVLGCPFHGSPELRTEPLRSQREPMWREERLDLLRGHTPKVHRVLMNETVDRKSTRLNSSH